MSEASKAASKVPALGPEVRTLFVLVLVTAALAMLVFLPRGTRLPVAPAPLHAPVAFDEPVVHLWK